MKVSSESASADVKAAEEFLETLDKLIVEENYLPEQIFTLDATSLFQKRCLSISYLRTLKHKAAKAVPVSRLLGQITVLLRDNVAGYKLKPFVVRHSEKARPFKHISKHTLQVYCRSNKKVMDDPAPLPRCPFELLCQQNEKVLFGEYHIFQDFAFCQ